MKRWILVRNELTIIPWPVCETKWVWVMVGEPVATRKEAMDLAKEHLSPKLYIAEIAMGVVPLCTCIDP